MATEKARAEAMAHSLNFMMSIRRAEEQRIRDFGFLGTKDEPRVIPGLPRSFSVRHALQHVHGEQGNCLKSRWGFAC
jgi:hypothetical protein